ncbi:transcriptional regulator [Candidatus Saccharibacteria bacterium]|nr:transcriptional regulator [Candidatus Saccharibacteria bacterium]MCB9821259.1 transcriptional regulator [Candidatus Nomurabacteria bacterium]
MIEQLFGSKTRVKLLRLFMSNPNRSFYVREITRKVEEQINSVRRELSNLLSIGIIKSDSSNNRLYYEVNQKYEHYLALSSMFGGRAYATTPKKEKPTKDKQATVEDKKSNVAEIPEEERALGNVELVILGGVFTRDKTAPVDLLIVGDVNQAALDKYVTELESSTGAEIRFATFAKHEFDYRRQIKDRFVVTMLEGKLSIKVDKNGILTDK